MFQAENPASSTHRKRSMTQMIRIGLTREQRDWLAKSFSLTVTYSSWEEITDYYDPPDERCVSPFLPRLRCLRRAGRYTRPRDKDIVIAAAYGTHTYSCFILVPICIPAVSPRNSIN